MEKLRAAVLKECLTRRAEVLNTPYKRIREDDNLLNSFILCNVLDKEYFLYDSYTGEFLRMPQEKFNCLKPMGFATDFYQDRTTMYYIALLNK